MLRLLPVVHCVAVAMVLILLVGCSSLPADRPPAEHRPPASPAAVTTPSTPTAAACPEAPAFVVPGSHGTVGGWLVDFASERNYMVNNVIDHLDRVAADPRYTFALAEVPTMIAIRDLQPDRLDQLRRLLAEGRVELSNAFYLNSAIDLSGGEALVRLGVEGIRWQQAVFGVRPRIASLVDTVGIHGQMPQIVSRLGLRGMVYSRNNPTGQVTHRWRAPDGTSVLAAGVGHYARWGPFFLEAAPMSDESITKLKGELNGVRSHDVPGVPTLLLAAGGDYGSPPSNPEQVGHVQRAWSRLYPGDEIRLGTISQYFDALERCAPALNLREASGDSPVSYNAFWSNIPRVKQAFRRTEHLLQQAELLAAFGSLEAGTPYPSTSLANAWTGLLLNMDRNSLWGAARGEVFESPTAWDVRDRFDAATATAASVLDEILGAATARPESRQLDQVLVANSLNWKRDDPVVIATPGQRGLKEVPCEALPGPDPLILCRPPLPPSGYRAFELTGPLTPPRSIQLPEAISTRFYTARLDPKSGAVTSVVVKPAGIEVLAGPVNTIVAERERSPVSPGDYLAARGQRRALFSSGDRPVTVTATKGDVATTIRTEQAFLGGGSLVTVTRFFDSDPRIDFETELVDVPDDTLLLADFPLASRAARERRGIPYGFSSRDPDVRSPLDAYFLGDEQKRLGFTDAIRPAIRWSSYDLQLGGVVALLDRGIPGREIEGNLVSLQLMNARDAYRGYANSWLSGRGRHRFTYSVLVGAGPWSALDVPRRAWELNAVPWVRPIRAGSIPGQSWLRTSPNVIVESVRRDGSDLEIRFVDWTGEGGGAEVRVDVPHRAAARTDFLGERAQPLTPSSRYDLQLAPQEIVTLRLRVDDEAPPAAPVLDYRPLAPPAKRASFDARHSLRGHPE